MDAALLDIPTYARTRARLSGAVAAGHPVVLLLGEQATLTTLLLNAVSRDLDDAGRAVHRAEPERLRRADLTHADPRIVVAVDRADLLSRMALLAIDEHLRASHRTQLLLAGLPSFRSLTALPGLVTLHAVPLVVTLPRLPPADAAAYLRTRPNAQNRRNLLRAAAGDPIAIERLAQPRLLPSLAEIAESRPLAPLLDRPLATLAGSLVLAVIAAAVAVPIVLRPVPHQVESGPPPNLPPIQVLSPRPADGPSYAVTEPPAAPDTAASGADSAVTVDHEDPDDLLSPRIVHLRPGDTLSGLYGRIYRGLDAPPFTAVQALNPPPLKPGARLVFPAPAEGWSGP